MVHASAGTLTQGDDGVLDVESGPAATNMITGAATARCGSVLRVGLATRSRYGGVVLQGIDTPGSEDMSVTNCFGVVSRYLDQIAPRCGQILASLRGDADHNQPQRL